MSAVVIDRPPAVGEIGSTFAWVRRHAWWIKRVMLLPVHLACFAIAVFFLVRLVPGDPVLTVTGGQITPEQYDAAQAALGLDGSLWTQLWSYLGRLARLDLGSSMVGHRPVISELAARLPATLELTVIGVTASAAVALAAASLIVFRPRNAASRLLVGYSRTAGSVTDFGLGIFLIFVLYARLAVVPAPLGRIEPRMGQPTVITHFPLIDAVLSGETDVLASMIRHLVLPVLVIVLTQASLLIKLLVPAMQAAVDDRATLFRVACGASRATVVASVLRRALPTVIPMFGTMFGAMLGSAVVLEQLFGLGGMGQYAVDAIMSTDLVALQGFLIVVAAMCLVTFLLVDIATGILDPRRRIGRQGVGS